MDGEQATTTTVISDNNSLPSSTETEDLFASNGWNWADEKGPLLFFFLLSLSPFPMFIVFFCSQTNQKWTARKQAGIFLDGMIRMNSTMNGHL